VIRAAYSAGKKIDVYADETRPFLQGARLTAWELQQDRHPDHADHGQHGGLLHGEGPDWMRCSGGGSDCGQR
jgi:methylthioribose-1-phosphate isomerase